MAAPNVFVVSYNVLSPVLTNTDMFPYLDEDMLDAKTRFMAVVKHISPFLEQGAILCLQVMTVNVHACLCACVCLFVWLTIKLCLSHGRRWITLGSASWLCSLRRCAIFFTVLSTNCSLSLLAFVYCFAS